MFTVGQFKTKLTPKLHGTSLSRIGDLYGSIGEAAFNVLSRIDPYTTIRRARIENAIYDKIYNYIAATDLKGNNKVVDIRPIGERSTGDTIVGSYSRQFDTKKYNDRFTIEVINGVKTLRIAKALTARTVLHRCDSLTLEGTVTASGDANNIDTDTLDFISGDRSIKFDLDGLTGQGIITFALNSAIDLSNMEDLGALFHWIKFPDATRINSFILRFGSGSGAYSPITITAPHDRTSYESNAWLLNRYDWEDAGADTGTPDFTAVDYIQIVINYDTGTALSNVKIDNITAALGKVYEMLYYSNCLFRDTTGATYKSVPTADSDVILIDDNDINMLLYEALIILGQEVKGKSMATDLLYADKRLNGNPKNGNRDNGLYSLYEEQYPSQAIEQQEDYYQFGEIGPHADDGSVFGDDND
jgi:hypothetical protein